MTYCLNQEPPQDLPIIGCRHTTDIYLFEFVGILGTIVGHSSVTSAALQCQFNRFFWTMLLLLLDLLPLMRAHDNFGGNCSNVQ